MRKTYSILDSYGGVTQQFEGTAIAQLNGLIEIYDTSETRPNPCKEYVKAIHCLAPGTTICHTEEVNG